MDPATISCEICCTVKESRLLTTPLLQQIAGEYARRVDRVLDVRQGELCWVVGTVYMDLPLKPNILEDISKEVCMATTFNLPF